MHHRIIFNVFCGILVFINSSQFEDASHAVQIAIHCTTVIVFTVWITLSRPYRSFSTNILYILAMVSVTQQLIFISMKVSIDGIENLGVNSPRLRELKCSQLSANLGKKSFELTSSILMLKKSSFFRFFNLVKAIIGIDPSVLPSLICRDCSLPPN